MTIVCATDFSPASQLACDVAAILARQHEEQLVIVHAIMPVTVPSMFLVGNVIDDMTRSAEAAMTETRERISRGNPQVTTRVDVGTADEMVLEEAERTNARMVVLGSVGQRGLKWLLGSTADRIVSRSRFPVMIVRGDLPAAEWVAGERPLRVTVAGDLAPSTGAAIEWAAHLPEHGRCEFTLAHVSSPPEEYERLGIDAPMRLDRTHPAVEEVVRRDLASAAARLGRDGEPEVVIESNLGRTADALLLIAKRQRADLLVVGRGREEGRHWWEQSVSRAIVRQAPMTVVCVPETAEQPTLALPRIRRVVAATDFSRLGNAAVAHALSLVPDDGEVLLVHALDESSADGDEQQRRRAELERLAVSADGGRKVQVEILTGDDAPRLISTAAERFGADVICVGARGRSGVARSLMGSVSQGVLLRSQRPVLVVQTPASTPAK